MTRRKTRTRKAPPGVRPTPAKVREALFNILRDRIVGASFLELYAGTGRVGADAISEGAEKVVWVEKNPGSLEGPGSGETDSSGKGRLAGADVHRFLRSTTEKYDIVFADPPYYTGELERLMVSLSTHVPLNEGGVFVLEHADRVEAPAAAGRLRQVKSYRYGDTRLTLYRVDEGADMNTRGGEKEVDDE